MKTFETIEILWINHKQNVVILITKGLEIVCSICIWYKFVVLFLNVTNLILFLNLASL